MVNYAYCLGVNDILYRGKTIQHGFIREYFSTASSVLGVHSIESNGFQIRRSADSRAKIALILPVTKTQAEGVRDYEDSMKQLAGTETGVVFHPNDSHLDNETLGVENLEAAPYYYSTLSPQQQIELGIGTPTVDALGRPYENLPLARQLHGITPTQPTEKSEQTGANCASFPVFASFFAGIPLHYVHPRFTEYLSGDLKRAFELEDLMSEAYEGSPHPEIPLSPDCSAKEIKLGNNTYGFIVRAAPTHHVDMNQIMVTPPLDGSRCLFDRIKASLPLPSVDISTLDNRVESAFDQRSPSTVPL